MRRRRSRAGTWPLSWVIGRMENARGSGASRDSTKEPKYRGTQPVTAARERGHAGGVIGKSRRKPQA